MSDRALDIRLSAGRDVGFLVWEGGEVIAAVTSRAELAQWLEERLGLIPGEREREEREFAAMRDAMGNVESFPNVIKTRTAPRGMGGLFRGKT
jgi:hypothetical protein